MASGALKELDALRVSYGEFGAQVADLLDDLFGLHHLDSRALVNARWDDEHCVAINLKSTGYATWDYNDLTRLVVLAHDRCIRVSLAPYAKGTFRLTFHPRAREGGMSRRHPTLEEHLEKLGRPVAAPTGEGA